MNTFATDAVRTGVAALEDDDLLYQAGEATLLRDIAAKQREEVREGGVKNCFDCSDKVTGEREMQHTVDFENNEELIELECELCAHVPMVAMGRSLLLSNLSRNDLH